MLVEHFPGQKVLNYQAQGDYAMARYALTGTVRGPINRNRRPEGGESYQDVADRAKSFLLKILFSDGARVSQVPDGPDDETTTTEETLPQGIPHCVIVSHNIFITELYECMVYWGKDHLMGWDYWANANW